MEKNIDKYPSIVSLDKTKKIIEQIQNSICKIYINEGGNGTGFFCHITDLNNNKKIPVMITNNHVINENDYNKNLKISFNNDNIYADILLDSNRKKYTNKDLDITIIEIKKEKDKINNKAFLEIDEKIYQNNSEVFFKEKSVYIIQYAKEIGASVSYGIIKDIDENTNELAHLCSTSNGSSGSPILNIENNKIIGVHKGFETERNNFNKGIFLKLPINEFLANKSNTTVLNNEYKNEIKITVKIDQSLINKEVYFLEHPQEFLEKDKEHNKYSHSHLSELNKTNIEVFINKEKYEYQKYFKPTKEGKYEIKLKFKKNIKDCSYMFYYCKNIIEVDFSLFKTNEITNMSNMFSFCTELTYLNLSNFNTEKVKNMSYLFSNCSSLKKIILSSFNTQNVIDMRNMFAFCRQLSFIDISSFNASPNLNCTNMFYNCWNLEKIYLNEKSFDKFQKEIEGKEIVFN